MALVVAKDAMQPRDRLQREQVNRIREAEEQAKPLGIYFHERSRSLPFFQNVDAHPGQAKVTGHT